jgi:hypothetical protein
MDDKKLIGYKDGMAVYVSDALLAQKGEHEVREQLGLIHRYPVKTDLNGNVVMVEGDSHEDAVQRYLSRTEEEAEALVLEFGGDTYESFSPAVRLSSLNMARLIDHVRADERAKVANALYTPDK